MPADDAPGTTVGSIDGDEALDAGTDRPDSHDPAHDPVSARRRVRAVFAGATTVLAVLLVWFALVGPNEISRFSLAAFLRIPIEGLVLVAVLVMLPRQSPDGSWQRWSARSSAC